MPSWDRVEFCETVFKRISGRLQAVSRVAQLPETANQSYIGLLFLDAKSSRCWREGSQVFETGIAGAVYLI
jgi:hypothetical protein